MTRLDLRSRITSNTTSDCESAVRLSARRAENSIFRSGNLASPKLRHGYFALCRPKRWPVRSAQIAERRMFFRGGQETRRLHPISRHTVFSRSAVVSRARFLGNLLAQNRSSPSGRLRGVIRKNVRGRPAEVGSRAVGCRPTNNRGWHRPPQGLRALLRAAKQYI